MTVISGNRSAGVEIWPVPFQNMQASRQTELARAFLLHVITKWLGNTPQIGLKHDLQVTNRDFARAWARSLSTGAAKSAAKGLQKGCKRAAKSRAAGARTGSHGRTRNDKSP